jgi:hypothetical protein
MANSKNYLEKDSDGLCYRLDYWKDDVDVREREIVLEEMKVEYGNGLFYCSEHEFCGDVGEDCGTSCKEYEPRNGKSGRCKHSKNTYEGTGKYFTLTRDKKLIAIK